MSEDDEERMVANPYLSEMDSLIRRTENAVEITPNMDAPTASIGDGPAWTGRKARELHDNYLSPNADPVRTALDNLVSDVETRKGEFDAEIPEGVANVIRADLNHR